MIEHVVDEIEATVHRVLVIFCIELGDDDAERVALEERCQRPGMMTRCDESAVLTIDDEFLECIGETRLSFFEPGAQLGPTSGAGDDAGAVDAVDVATALVGERRRRPDRTAEILRSLGAAHNGAHRGGAFGHLVLEFLGESGREEAVATAVPRIDRTLRQLLRFHEVLEAETALAVTVEKFDRRANDRIGVGRSARSPFSRSIGRCHVPHASSLPSSVKRVTTAFASVQDVRNGLRQVNYLADDGIAGVVYLAQKLGKPVLIEGPAGTGKTQLAKSVAELTGARLIRLQCYEGLDESKALYEWNYKKQLLRIQADKSSDSWNEVHDDIFSDEFLLTRPLLEAISSTEPVVLLIDEVDRVEVETEALLLEILSEYQVSIPELGTITAKQIPLVFLTSNNTRELSEALKRRCLYLHVDYPDVEREKQIVMTKVPDIGENLADQLTRIVRSIRQLDLKKSPSVSETLDWARTLLLLGLDHVDEQNVKDTLHVLLKYQTDIAKAAKELSVDE